MLKLKMRANMCCLYHANSADLIISTVICGIQGQQIFYADKSQDLSPRNVLTDYA